MQPEQSKRGRPSVACANCRAARRACDGKFADCAKYVSLPTTASDAAGPSQPASPPPSRPVRSKVSPGGSEHRGAPIALAAEPAYSPEEEMRDRTDRRYDLKQRRTSEEAVVAVGEQLASAGWAADAVIEEDGRTRSGQLDSKQADGRLMELLVVASASVSPDAPLRTSAHPSLCAPPYPLTPPHPGQDDETADGETTWFATARGPEEKNESTITCGPTTLVKNHYSVPVEWVNLHELNDEFAIFKAWPSEQNRVAATHLLAVPELKWAKEEGGLFYLARSEYDLACGQV
ncbi:hypothetical protein EMIHUDRAFT_118700 [Emiliania huxleyi CCMP1516]|uniref:Zn(2)-C6 fungal-type domain-containing protein n=2 Tax=Emiliania huxleyi TaxID=2903 RepID=A0A0D3J0Y1_EMIH1|nr:hypothetical protein EMIHUDRAFT_118700 [Emiliania huxleyi CCMP1516]EOD17166.1 hypothetical protein EMIHUDRAFT_118700 [Emiliania huxleyi CCMP1516]|eukprot:XP_005769595.1 hypothetical protein EMIHUDRAFT_118700 [Emiliania huxleyi CCMP1516]